MAVRDRSWRVAIVVLAALTLAGCSIAIDRRTGVQADDIVWVGDSMMFGLMEHIAKQFEYTPTKARYVGGPGTGLLAGQGRFGPGTAWEVYLQQAIDEYDPQIIVLETLGVYPDLIWGDVYYAADGTAVVPDSDLFWEEWEAAARRLDAIAKSGGASVWWVIPPEFDVEWQWRDRIHRANEITRSLGDPLIELQPMIADYADPYDALEVWSGLHFTEESEPAAAKRLVRAVVEFRAPTP